MIQVITNMDVLLGTSLAGRLPQIDPTVRRNFYATAAVQSDMICAYRSLRCLLRQLGSVAMTVACNEMLEPLRLPIVVMTTPTVVRFFGYK